MTTAFELLGAAINPGCLTNFKMRKELYVREIAVKDLDLTIVPAHALTDPIWQKCMDWAVQGRGKEQRYGALCIGNERILGGGRSRLLGKKEPFPLKTTFFLHAERSAVGSALLNLGITRTTGSDILQGATIYVAGFLVKERRPLIRRAGFETMCTCVQCPKLCCQFGLNVAIMTEHGWVQFTGPENLANATANLSMIRQKNLSTTDFRRLICL